MSQSPAVITIIEDASAPIINRHVYGHFSEHLGRCIYDGFWVSNSLNTPKKGRLRTDIIEALKKIQIPNLRWPGGCFADEYHWRNAIGTADERVPMINTNWGGLMEDNSFGTHEFLELCELLNTEPYIVGNVGSGSVEEMASWVEYLNSSESTPITKLREKNGRNKPWNVKFWGMGNESWGCGGNMTPEFYADRYKLYAEYLGKFQTPLLFTIACGANSSDYTWTEVLMKKIGTGMSALSLHHYTIPTSDWNKKGSATSFDETEYMNAMKNCLFMEELIQRHSAIMDKFDPEKKVALVVDEWGVWTDVEPGTNPGFLYQQNSLRDALIAGVTLNIFNNHSYRVRMANLAQTVNVLQALILTRERQILLTPTYHVFDMYQGHMDARLLPVKFHSPEYILNYQKVPAISVSVSRDPAGTVRITLVNIDPNNNIPVIAKIPGIPFQKVQGQIISSNNITDINSFENPVNIGVKSFEAFKKQGDDLVIDVPPKSVVLVKCR